MAQFQVIPEYSSLNGVGGTCALCNASKRTKERPERVITTELLTDMPDAPPGVWPEMYMEFCESCVVEMGTLFGMLDEHRAEKLTKQMAALRQENKQLQDQIDDLTSVLSATDVVKTHLKQYEVEKTEVPDVLFEPPPKSSFATQKAAKSTTVK